jgi:DNA-binding NarL/FixJ family response regulator
MVAMGPAPIRTIVADDVEDVVVLLSAALESSGRFEVVGTASDGSGAAAEAARHQPDLVLLDLAMPGVGGLEALPEVRSACPGARVVVVSGFPRGTLGDAVVARGAVGYVEKRLSARQLVDDILAVAGLLEMVEAALAGRTRLDADARSSAAARRFVEEALAQSGKAELLDVVNLCVSELVTNAVLHTSSAPDLAVWITATGVRVEVGDEGGDLPGAEPEPAALDAVSGRGLSLVESLATAWGVIPRPSGKTVWFEVARPDD